MLPMRLTRHDAFTLARRMAQQHMSMSGVASAADSGVLLEHGTASSLVTLNRPKALNALNMNMVRHLTPAYRSWLDKNEPRVVVMKGAGGKAFCAGGDIRAIYDGKQEGQPLSELTRFFNEEYVLNQLIAGMPAHMPHVALLNGITMGGGVGLSVHGRYRVATDNSVFAMPETAIGFFCDVGGSFFLPRLPGSIGMWLALTGARLKGADLYHAGIATHFVKSDRFEDLQERLLAVEGPELPRQIEAILAEFNDDAVEAGSGNTIAAHRDAIERCFSAESVEEIFARLEVDGDKGWAEKVLKTMHNMSPTALKVVHRQLREGAQRDIAACFQMESIMAEEFMRRDDFFEGVRAVLVDKDRNPRWQPTELSSVTAADVDRYFTKQQ